MSGVKKDTIQKILLIALSAMTVSMILISVFNYKDNRQKNEYLEHEKELVEEELMEIIKNYDHLAKQNTTSLEEVKVEKEKAKELLQNIKRNILDYETIIKYRKQLLQLRKDNQKMQQKLNSGMSAGSINTTY